MGAGTFIRPGDISHDQPLWLHWSGGRPATGYPARRDAVREVLTGDERTLAQGALA